MSSNTNVSITATLGTGVSAAAGLGLTSAQLTFDDEFNGFTSSNSTTGWRTMLPFYGTSARTLPTGETDYYSDSTVGANPFTNSNGVLTITSTRVTASAATNNQPWVSGAIQSQYLATQTYGYFEAGINVTSTAGFWPSFWLFSVDQSLGGEIDAAEILTGHTNQINDTTHVITTAGAKVATLTQVTLPTNLSQGFHAIGVDWEPDYVTWYCDGVVTSRQATAAYGLDQPMFMVLLQAVGGWAGTPAASTTSAAMNVDYVRTYATANTTSVSGTGVIKTGTIAGTVTNAAGAALANVTVTLLDAQSQVVATDTTDAAGAFSIASLAAGSYKLLYTAPTGYAPKAGSAANAISGLTGTLTVTNGTTTTVPTEMLAASTGGTVTGQVVYKTNTWSTPPGLGGVTVSLMNGSTTVATTVTNAAGTYTFTNVAAGSYQVKFVTEHYKTFSTGPGNATTGVTGTVSVANGATTTIATETYIPTPGSMTGRIMFDADGAGSGAATAMGGVTLTVTDYYGNLLGTTTTNSSGYYSFTGIAPGYQYLAVVVPSGDAVMTGAQTTKVLVASARGNPVDTIVLKGTTTSTTGNVSGTVLLGTAADANVTVKLLNSSGTAVGTATTNASGVFTISGIAPGSYTIAYTAPTGQTLVSGPNASSVTVAAGATTTVANEVLAAAVATITGTVTLGSAGQSGVTVTLLNAAGTATVATATTNASGAFSFTGLAAGTYKLSYAAPANYTLASGPNGSSVTVTAGQTLALATETLAASQATVTGTVTYAGAGQSGVAVKLLNSAGTAAVATATTNASGTFSFTGLTAGSYKLSYTAPANYSLASGPNGSTITVTAGQTLALATEALIPAPATITGTVTYAGAAQSGVAVKLLDSTGTVTVATATSDASGSFSFTGLAAGSYKLSYTAPANEILQSGPDGSTVTVTAGQTLALATEALGPAAATLTGALQFAGVPLAGRTITLLDQSGTAVATGTTDAGGSFSFGNLTAGIYSVRYTTLPGEALNSGDPANTSTATTAPLTLAAGQTLALGTEHLLLAPVALTALGYTTVSAGNGNYTVTAPASVLRSTVTLGDGTDSVNLTGWADKITLGNGNQTVALTGNNMAVQTGNGNQSITLASSFSSVVIGDTSGTSTVSLTGGQNVLLAGNGNVTVNAAAATGSSTITLGDGNSTVTVGGSGNIVTVGAGDSTLTVGGAGTYGSTIHAGGAGASGAVTVTIAGRSNTVDVGAGTTFINATSNPAGDTFVLNGSGGGLTTISGFSAVAGFTLDLTRTLASTNIGTDLSRIGSYVTATSVNGGADTLLSVDPTGAGGAGYGFALLSGVHASSTMIADMTAKNAFTLH